MKKLVFILTALLAMLLILSGCVGEGQKNSARIIDSGVVTEENPNLFTIPCEEVEQMSFPEMYWFGDNLLFFETVYDEYVSPTDAEDYEGLGEYSTCTARLKIISIKDGSLIAEKDFPEMYLPMVQVGEKRIALYDVFAGEAFILNKRLKTVREYSFEGSEIAEGVLDSDLDTLYIFCYDSGLYRCDLKTKEKECILDAYGLYPCGSSQGKAYFYYTDKETQRNCYKYIDLETNTICEWPTNMPSDSCDGYESALLMRNRHDFYEYELVSEGAAYKITADEQDAALSDNGHLIIRNDYCTEVDLYDLDGGFVSSLSFENEYEHSFFSDNFLWSDLCGGYFFTDNLLDSTALMFYDTNVVVSGSDLLLEEKKDEVLVGEVLSPEIYERAAQLSEKYDLDIRIGELCELDYVEDYDGTEVLADNDMAKDALDVLESALESYPEGFFTQLQFGDVSKIRIEVVAYIPSAGGFAQQKDDHYLIAVDGAYLTNYVVFHEISHVIDKRLEWDAELREGALYSEEQWLSLQPEGFDYAYSYDVPYEFEEENFDSDYFAMEYALTYPTEDRAVLMGTAMDEDYSDLFELEEDGTIEDGLYNKLDYYSDCIRDCFDTEGWPEVTEWEKLLEAE